MDGDDSTFITGRRQAGARHTQPPVLALAVIWSRSEPHRIGEVAMPAPEPLGDASSFVLGRSPGAGGLELMRLRPGQSIRTGPPLAGGISRQQWRIHPRRKQLLVENLGRRDLIHNGVATPRALARVGDRLEIHGELLMLVVVRPRELPSQVLPPELLPPFGEADAFDVVGESVAAWELRRQLAFAAGRSDHVLLHGGSGSGKELAARAIHALSPRRSGALVSRNAATLPDGLIDAELFGNPRDYPNPGTPDRPGLIGAADRGSLFLDEIGEISHALQAHLLRVIDGGEYHRLGEARARRADVRVIAATNRDPGALKHDLLSRLRLRVRLPGLDKRREDIPLIARHLLRKLAAGDPTVAERAFPDGDPDGDPVWTAELVSSLVSAPYPGNVRELQTHLWEALARSTGSALRPAPPAEPPWSEEDESSGADEDREDATVDSVDPNALTEAQVRTALHDAEGNRERASRVLGLRNRHQLLRVMRRLGIETTRADR